jgi:hypothetical protein
MNRNVKQETRPPFWGNHGQTLGTRQHTSVCVRLMAKTCPAKGRGSNKLWGLWALAACDQSGKAHRTLVHYSGPTSEKPPRIQEDHAAADLQLWRKLVPIRRPQRREGCRVRLFLLPTSDTMMNHFFLHFA